MIVPAGGVHEDARDDRAIWHHGASWRLERGPAQRDDMVNRIGRRASRQPSAGGTHGMLWTSIPSSAKVSASSGVVSP